MFLTDNVVESNLNTDPETATQINYGSGSATLIIIIIKVRFATWSTRAALRQSPSLPQVQHKDRSIRRSLPQVQHKDRSIRRARAHLVTARVPTHLHIRGYVKVRLATTGCPWASVFGVDPDSDPRIPGSGSCFFRL